jgi:hypothetical protein
VILLALLLTVQEAGFYRPTGPTIVAEPVALYLAAADRDRDGRTTLAEMRQGLVETTSADPPWANGADYSVGYIVYSDWALRWLGDRNAIPTPLEIDRNGDNRVSFDEFRDRMEAIFTRLDTDKNGALTRAELLSVRRSSFDDRPDRRRDQPRQQPPR